MKHFTFVAFLGLCLISFDCVAQCTGNRYRDYVFTNYDLSSNIIYGNNINLGGSPEDLKLDVYEPQGDVVAERPLMIIAHGGNFLGGSKTGTDVVPMCEDFVKMGYVVASIDYRVGMNGLPFPGPDSVDATESVMRAVHDAKAAVRFFKKDYSESGNTYGVDTSKIFFAGVSAGGFMAVHLAYLDDLSELPTYIDTTQAGLGGGADGLSGNPGYTSDVTGIINICGALRDTAWMYPGDTPILSFHGDGDATVPFGTDIISLLGVYPLLYVDGSESIHIKADQIGIENCFWEYPVATHTPHVSNAAHYDTTVVLMRNFMVTYVCGDALDCSFSNPISVAENQDLIPFDIYPNPASSHFTVDLTAHAGNVQFVRLLDATGRLIETLPTNQSILQIDRGELPAGVYFVEVTTESGTGTQKIILE